MRILKVSKPFLKHNKMERLSNGPHWVLLRRVPSGDKTFSRFQKGGLPPLKQKVQTPFLKRNRMEKLSNGPHWVLLRRVPSGDKTFLKFQKGGVPPLKRKVQTPFPNNKMERLSNGPPLGSALQSPFGG